MSDNKDHKRQDNVRTKAVTAGKVKAVGVKLGQPHKHSKNPKFLDDRVAIWNELFDA